MLEPTTRPTGSKPAFSTHRYSLTERSDVNSPHAFICSRSLACSARPSVLVGSYVDMAVLLELGAEADRHDRLAQRRRVGLMRAKGDRGAKHVLGDNEEMLGVAGTLVLVVIDLVGQGRDDHFVRAGGASLAPHLFHRQLAGGVDALSDLDE